MSRWSRYDEDEARLPEGMRRIGYDADSQTYTFEDTNDGSVWEGQPGNRYGEMRRVSGPQPHYNNGDRMQYDEEDEQDWTGPPGRRRSMSSAVKMQKHSDWKYLAPFLLLVILVLLLVFKAVGASFWPASPSRLPAAPLKPNGATGGDRSNTNTPTCGEGQVQHMVQPGDTCWIIAEQRGMSLYQLKKMNKGINCDRLMPGAVVCITDEVMNGDD